jgi:hypothetical protein
MQPQRSQLKTRNPLFIIIIIIIQSWSSILGARKKRNMLGL